MPILALLRSTPPKITTMTNERSETAEQLLNYLAIGLVPREALAYYLIADENVPLKTVETAGWADGGIEGAFNTAKRKISSNEHSEIARDYWRSRRDEVNNYEEEIEDIETTLDLRAVRQILQNE